MLNSKNMVLQLEMVIELCEILVSDLQMRAEWKTIGQLWTIEFGWNK